MKTAFFSHIAAAGVLLCASCTYIPRREMREPVVIPQAESTAVSESVFPNEWWRLFEDPQLDRLIARTLSGNLTIEQAAARLRQAEAAAVKSGAARFPSLTGSAGAGTTRRRIQGRGTVAEDDYSLGLAAAYELDLWGRVASGRRAALRAADASLFDLQTAAITVVGETVRTYFEWQQLQSRYAVLSKQLSSREKMLSVIEKRFEAGQAGALDVLQQRERVAASKAAIPPVEASIEASLYRLAVLAGEPPMTGLDLIKQHLPELPEAPEGGFPADLLSRRPDLRAAWARLEAADWNVRAAQADRLPAIRLTGSASWRDDSVDSLFDNWVMNLAAGLAVPLIDGGSRRAEVARTRALADERVAAYREAAFQAMAEVETALSSEMRRREYLKAVRRQLAASSSAAEEAFRRYTQGMESYFEALSAETARQALEITELQARYDLLAARVQLCRTLGGDWQQILDAHR